jgi:N-acetyl-anhydromuramyl-L-alanine amidase AmpD
LNASSAGTTWLRFTSPWAGLAHSNPAFLFLCKLISVSPVVQWRINALDRQRRAHLRFTHHTKVAPAIERGRMIAVSGIIIHQTDSPTAQATLNGYSRANASGAHFLIDKDGKIYQTASLTQSTHHVGWIKSRCIAEHRCSLQDQQQLKNKLPGRGIGQVEIKKSWPDRYPSNSDSIGIEIVGEALPRTGNNRVYEPLTANQQMSLQWLVRELASTLGIKLTEVFRHYEVSWKNLTEAKSASW